LIHDENPEMYHRENKPQPPLASLPPATRIYAVGDIHGCAKLLADVTDRIDDDLRRRPVQHSSEVYLGDYIDRGADSFGVIEQLALRLVRNRAICLRGNHESLLEAFLLKPEALSEWLPCGAQQTLASYGLGARDDLTPATLRHRLHDRLPRIHQLFLQCLRNSYCCGDFFFVHAGIRPNVLIEHQEVADMIWIRDEFLDATESHGKYIVHGHTPVPYPDIRSNRINIDTGAWRSGVLTCVAIEGDTIVVL
jgi:serine/threonine protein phosphatase 1